MGADRKAIPSWGFVTQSLTLGSCSLSCFFLRAAAVAAPILDLDFLSANCLLVDPPGLDTAPPPLACQWADCIYPPLLFYPRHHLLLHLAKYPLTPAQSASVFHRWILIGYLFFQFDTLFPRNIMQRSGAVPCISKMRWEPLYELNLYHEGGLQIKIREMVVIRLSKANTVKQLPPHFECALSGQDCV